jgi:hypothetical protein
MPWKIGDKMLIHEIYISLLKEILCTKDKSHDIKKYFSMIFQIAKENRSFVLFKNNPDECAMYVDGKCIGLILDASTGVFRTLIAYIYTTISYTVGNTLDDDFYSKFSRKKSDIEITVYDFYIDKQRKFIIDFFNRAL